MRKPKREKLVGAWIKLHNEERHDLHSSLSIRVIITRGMRWMRHVTGIETIKIHAEFSLGSRNERRHFKNLGGQR